MLINVIKINILAAVFIAVAMIISHLIKNKYSVRWKYFVWLFIGILMLIPFDFINAEPVIDVKIPQNIYVGENEGIFSADTKIQNDSVKSSGDQVYENENNSESVGGGNDIKISEEIQSASDGSYALDGSESSGKNNAEIPSYDQMMFEQNENFAQTYGNVFNQESDDIFYQNGESSLNQTDSSEINTDSVRESNYEEISQTAISVNNIIKVLNLIWLCGIAILAIYHILQYIFSSRRLKRWRSRRLNDSEREIYAKVCDRLDINKAPELYINYEIYTPLMAGIIKPCLYLPVEKYTNWELELIFVHELNHYKHKDVWYKFFLLIVKTVYWFNPLLHIMFKEAGRDLESICDSRVIEYTKNKEEKISYGKLLLKTAIEKKPVSEVAADLNDGASKFKERVIYMMNAKKMKKGFPIAIALIISFVLMNSLIGCSFTQETGDSSAVVENENNEEVSDQSDVTSESVSNEVSDIESDEQNNSISETTIADNEDAALTETTEPSRVWPQEIPDFVSEIDVDSMDELPSVGSEYQVYEVTYDDIDLFESDKEELIFYEIDITESHPTRFEFSLRKVKWEGTEKKIIDVVLEDKIAMFVGDGTAAKYIDDKYDLTFTFPAYPEYMVNTPNVSAIMIDGFEPSNGHLYITNSFEMYKTKYPQDIPGFVEEIDADSMEDLSPVSAKYQLYELTYMDIKMYPVITGYPDYYVIKINDVKETSFDFSIIYIIFRGGEEIEYTVIDNKTAVFVGDGTVAKYIDDNYDLTFTFPNYMGALPDIIDIMVDGFEPMKGYRYATNMVEGHGFD